jgi:predicted PurR-regulated permease PerM
MNGTLKFPFYAKLSFILLILFITVTALSIGQNIFVPTVLALLFAILLRPVVIFFNKKLRIPHLIASIITVVLFIFVIAGVIFFVSRQIGDITSDWDKIQHNLEIQYQNLQGWVQRNFNVSYVEQNRYLKEATHNSLNGANLLTKGTLDSFTGILLNIILVPFLVFLFLLYRNLFLKFLSRLFPEEQENQLQDILHNIKISVQSFLSGLLIELGIVSALTSIGFMITGIQYAVLLGLITGILNLIPYIGIFIAGLLSILASLTSSSDISTITSIIVVNILVQIIDNNIVTPWIVSSRVKINAIVSILGIIIGSSIAGIAGMFLAIPIIAILKIIFDRIESLKPWGFLMGDDLPKNYEWGKIKLPSLNGKQSNAFTDVKHSSDDNSNN